MHESDQAMCSELERRGYTLDESTRAMGMALDVVRRPTATVELGPPDWHEYLRIAGVSPDFRACADRAAYHVLVARLDGENDATAMAVRPRRRLRGSTTSARPSAPAGAASPRR